jgi:NADPH-dependent ferric siderophore reductase
MTSPHPGHLAQTLDPLAAPARRPGLIGRALIRLLMRHARVVEAETIVPAFRLITLEGPELQGVSTAPGQKLQIAMGSALVARTYTPVGWDASAGRVQILGHVHGTGPGSSWVRQVRAGDECDVFGPRSSIAASQARRQILIGDETSIGLVCALLRHSPYTTFCGLLEVNAPGGARQVLQRLSLSGVELFGRTPGETHLEDMEQRLSALASPETAFVLTGKASTVQRLRRTLLAAGTPSRQITSKAYWALGKTGLD